jgi:thioredoxin
MSQRTRLTGAASITRIANRPMWPQARTKMSSARPITTADFEREVISATTPTVVDFWAAWCGPCRAVAPQLERLAERQSGRVSVRKVDIDAEPELAERYGVSSIPTIVLFANGQEAARVVGAMPAEGIERGLGLPSPATA